MRTHEASRVRMCFEFQAYASRSGHICMGTCSFSPLAGDSPGGVASGLGRCSAELAAPRPCMAAGPGPVLGVLPRVLPAPYSLAPVRFAAGVRQGRTRADVGAVQLLVSGVCG